MSLVKELKPSTFSVLSHCQHSLSVMENQYNSTDNDASSYDEVPPDTLERIPQELLDEYDGYCTCDDDYDEDDDVIGCNCGSEETTLFGKRWIRWRYSPVWHEIRSIPLGNRGNHNNEWNRELEEMIIVDGLYYIKKTENDLWRLQTN